MVSDGVNRREFLQYIGAGTLGTTLYNTPVTATQESTNNQPTFSPPIEEAFNITTSEDTTSLGAITENYLFVSYQSWNRGGDTSSSKVAKVNRFTGETDWSKNIDDYLYGPHESEGHLYFAGNDAAFSLDAATGDEIWRQSLEESTLILGLVDDQVFIQGIDYVEATKGGEEVDKLTDCTLYALDSETGEITWKYSSTNAIFSPTATDNYILIRESEAYYANSELVYDEGQLVALSKSNGVRSWESNGINPTSIFERDGTILVHTEDNQFYFFNQSGEKIEQFEDNISNYYITGEIVLLTEVDGGIRIVDHDGVEQTEQLLYSETVVNKIRSGLSLDEFLLVTDTNELIAIDLDSYSEQWRINQPADEISAQFEIAFVTHQTNQITAINVKEGEIIWNDSIPTPESMWTTINDGLLYVSGDGAPLRAYSGRRGRALAALNRIEDSNTLSSTISSIAPGASHVSNARSAFEQGNYDKVHRLINNEQRRRLLIDGGLGVSGLSAIYGTSRIGTSKWQQRRLDTAVQRVATAYPIDEGELSGLEPTDLIAQGHTAINSLNSKSGVPLRQVLSDDYSDLHQTLVQLADRHTDLVSASKDLATSSQSHQPESWTTDLRSAVKEGDIQRIDSLLESIERAEDLLSELQSLSNTLAESSLSASADQFRPLVKQEISQRGTAIDGLELSQVLVTLKDGIEAIDGYEGSFSIFDIDQKRATILEALKTPNNITAPIIQEIDSYSSLFEVAETVEEEFAQVDFEASNISRVEIVNSAKTAFSQSGIEELQSIAETLQQIRIGRWSNSDLFSVSPREFEYLVAALFGDMGYQVAVTDQQDDKGVDVIARNAVEVLAIQVKQYSRGNKVGRPAVQKVIGAMAQAGADRAVIGSSSGFTRAAIEASRELGDAVELINGEELVQLLTESKLHPQSTTSEYKSKASSKSTSESRSGSNQRTSHTTGGEEPMGKMDAYDILGIKPEASQEKIKSQYREKVKNVHPDTGGSAEEFKKVKQAFNLLHNG